MDPNEFFSMSNNPNYEIGHGKRGLRSESELAYWDENTVQIKCLNPTCGNFETIPKNVWLENIPLECSVCHMEQLAHEYIVLGAFIKEMIKKYNPDGVTFNTVEDFITEPFRQACIVRYVKVRSQV